MPGALAHALATLHKHSINLLAIGSYDDLHHPKRSDFFVTAEGHEDDSAMGAAIAELRSRAVAFKVLGSFPAADSRAPAIRAFTKGTAVSCS